MNLDGDDFQRALVAHRPALLRHCYRMLGCFPDAEDLVQEALERAWASRDTYRGTAPLQRWLFAIATNACLNALVRRQRRRELPHLDLDPARDEADLGQIDVARWVGPAPDALLFPDPAEETESRQTVALAFVALLQRIPPRQRAALLLKDVVGWSAEDIAMALNLTVSSVNSALHRARASVQTAPSAADEPSPDAVQAFVQAWEARDLDLLLRLLRDDVTLAMPPYAAWFRGVDPIARLFRSDRFQRVWSDFAKVLPTRANALPAFAFYRADNRTLPHALMVVRFAQGRVAEMVVYIGAESFGRDRFFCQPPHSF